MMEQLTSRRTLLAGLAGLAGASFIPWRGAAATGRQPTGYIRTNWSRDPFSLGSYSYVAKAATRQDHRTLAATVGGRLYFAGEAAHPDYNGTVHAAYESGQYAARAVMTAGHQRIAVIGAGTSGLSAAHRLNGSGHHVTVFEARDRIGGRVWTDKRLGTPLDLGASWIHGTRRNPLTKLADSLGLTRVPTGDDYIIRGAGGRKIRWRNAPDWIENVVEIQHEAGADSSEINMYAYEDDEDYGGAEVVFPGGYSAIFDALAGDYELVLSTQVSDVAFAEDGVRLTKTTGKQTAFDAVIVTVPLGVLKQGSINFTPPLPAAKRAAISRLGMGTLDKLYLKYNTAFWDNKTWIVTPETGVARGQFNGWLNLYKYTGEPVIMAFNGGPPALELAHLADEDMVARGVQALARAYPL